MSVTFDRMMNSAPTMYSTSFLYKEIQSTVAEELETTHGNIIDLRAQFHVATATWGLQYWEALLHIQPLSTEDYPERRTRILARLRSIGNFSADMIRSISSLYTDVEPLIYIEWDTGTVVLEYNENMPYIEQFRERISDVIHAHLDIKYRSVMYVVNTITIVQRVQIIKVGLEADSYPYGFIGGVDAPIRLEGRVRLNGMSRLDGSPYKKGPDQKGTFTIKKNGITVESGDL